MANVITKNCMGTLDRACVDVCPVDCIYYVNDKSLNDKYGRPASPKARRQQLSDRRSVSISRPSISKITPFIMNREYPLFALICAARRARARQFTLYLSSLPVAN